MKTSEGLNFWSLYETYVRDVVRPHDNDRSKGVSYWRNEIFFNTLIFLAPVSIIALVPSVYMSFANHVPVVGTGDLLAFVLIVFIMLNRTMKLETRKAFFFLIIFSLSVVLLYYLGRPAPGLLFLLAGTILSSTIYSATAGWYSAIASTLVCFSFGLLIYFKFDVPIASEYDVGTWIAISSNLVLLSIVCVQSINPLLEGLKASLEDSKNLSSKASYAYTELQKIMDASLDMICSINIDGKFEKVSSASLAMLGYQPDELAGKNYIDFVYEGDVESTLRRAADIMGGIPVASFENCYRHKDGHTIPVLWSATWDKNDKMMYCVAKDITERKAYEEKLIEKEHQLVLLIENSPAALAMFDMDMRYIIASKRWSTDYKLTDQEIIGRSHYDVFKIMPLHWRAIHERCLAGASEKNDEEPFTAMDGTDAWLRWEIHPWYKTQKEIGGIIMLTEVITERKKIESDKLKLIEGLQLKNNDLQQFSYIVSHNLRAPIANILGLVTVIDAVSAESKFFLDKLSDEARHLDDVVKDINTIVSARASGTAKTEFVNFETKLILIKQVLEDQIEQSGATITYNFSEIAGLDTIRSYMYSMLYNLISNAIKYRNPEVSLYIHVKSSLQQGVVCLSVEDNGMGIDLAKNGGKVFGLYKRFHTGSIPGKGIGLNLVKTHAESLGGRIAVESEVQKGSIFRIYIPQHYEGLKHIE